MGRGVMIVPESFVLVFTISKSIEGGGGHDRTIFVCIGFHIMKSIENGGSQTYTDWMALWVIR